MTLCAALATTSSYMSTYGDRLKLAMGLRDPPWGQAELARAYVQAGIAHLSPRPAQLVAVGGLSGSGKSYASRRIAPEESSHAFPMW